MILKTLVISDSCNKSYFNDIFHFNAIGELPYKYTWVQTVAAKHDWYYSHLFLFTGIMHLRESIQWIRQTGYALAQRWTTMKSIMYDDDDYDNDDDDGDDDDDDDTASDNDDYNDDINADGEFINVLVESIYKATCIHT